VGGSEIFLQGVFGLATALTGDGNHNNSGPGVCEQSGHTQMPLEIRSKSFDTAAILTTFSKNNAFLGIFWFKGLVQCFSMLILMNKCFLLNPEKILV